MTQVAIKRTELRTPTVDDPDRMVIQVEYRAGELPPRFLYIPKADWTEEEEARRIREDMEQVTKTTTETREI